MISIPSSRPSVSKPRDPHSNENKVPTTATITV
jgi:hypothetical protein